MSISALLISFVRVLTEINWNSLQRVTQHIFSWRKPTGSYEVLDYRVELELCDPQGYHAIYRKYQEVRFLQNNVMAYSDKAWGDGDIFADYKCTPGVPVDHYRDGYRHRVLISLREIKNKGDLEIFQIERHIHNGFTTPTESLQTDTDHYIHHLAISVVFPTERHPTSIRISEQNSSKGMELNSDNSQTLPDGRLKVTWRMKRPRIYGSYILTWVW